MQKKPDAGKALTYIVILVKLIVPISTYVTKLKNHSNMKGKEVLTKVPV
jgi:hypothetical protein